MSKVYETLKKKNDTTVEVYPNIERTNIPDGAINTAKIEDKAVTFNKLSDALQDDVTHFNNIYDADDGKITVNDIEVIDDINCTNLTASNKVTTNDLEVTNRINSDEIITNSITSNDFTDGDGDSITPLFNHSINVRLINHADASDKRYFKLLLQSTRKSAITSFAEFFSEMQYVVNITFIQTSSNTIGWLDSVSTNPNLLSIYCDDGNNGLTDIEFDDLDDISDNVSLA